LISIENNMELISINNQFLKYVFLPLVILYWWIYPIIQFYSMHIAIWFIAKKY
jgi:hypothetical protein